MSNKHLSLNVLNYLNKKEEDSFIELSDDHIYEWILLKRAPL